MSIYYMLDNHTFTEVKSSDVNEVVETLRKVAKSKNFCGTIFANKDYGNASFEFSNEQEFTDKIQDFVRYAVN